MQVTDTFEGYDYQPELPSPGKPLNFNNDVMTDYDACVEDVLDDIPDVIFQFNEA